jgi:hypothetical protein
MTRYCGSQDIYSELVEKSEQNWLLGLVAFAIVEEQRIEWMRHYELTNSRPPSDDEIRAWYHQQPSSVLLRAKGTAENALLAYSEEVLAEVYEQQQREVRESVIVAEIRELKKFWPQFGVNLAGGFASSLLFAAVLTLLAFIVFSDASPIAIGAHLTDKK